MLSYTKLHIPALSDSMGTFPPLQLQNAYKYHQFELSVAFILDGFDVKSLKSTLLRND